jgi:hypothetical protein
MSFADWTRRCSPPTVSETMAAYDTFADAANSGALKVVLQGSNVSTPVAETEQSVAVA